MTKKNVHEKIHEKIFISIVEQLCKELECDLIELGSVLRMTNVRKEISDSLHFTRYHCLPERCKACKENIPHDSYIFDSESIFTNNQKKG